MNKEVKQKRIGVEKSYPTVEIGLLPSGHLSLYCKTSSNPKSMALGKNFEGRKLTPEQLGNEIYGAIAWADAQNPMRQSDDKQASIVIIDHSGSKKAYKQSTDDEGRIVLEIEESN